ncbi:metal-dependent transcriptional regulator [Spirochaeta lutea]|uniref:metal-dependent transcriptional regulator n=1 Tax=Spirochaeta lutea TaxID=1480694 RepID=UPI000690A67E|nr:metal-dependent transcriptional regulator [Spirochaeta lutea]
MSDVPADLQKQFPAAIEYLTDIYVIQREYGRVTNARLADWMQVSRSAVTQGISRLKRLGLTIQPRYEAIQLTEKGRELAVTFLRRHYLVEHLLVRTLGYPWDKADEEAKVLQGAISDDLAEYLYDKLGKPHTCPHGNPFPEDPIEERLVKAQALDAVEPERELRLLRITEEGEAYPGMLHFCYNHQLSPGSRLSVTQTEPLRIVLHRPESGEAENIEIPPDMAKHIRVEYLST